MLKLSFMLSTLMLINVACNDEYIAKKREGLKPYPEHEEKEAQEDKE